VIDSNHDEDEKDEPVVIQDKAAPEAAEDSSEDEAAPATAEDAAEGGAAGEASSEELVAEAGTIILYNKNK
jgi:hypothetical protein